MVYIEKIIFPSEREENRFVKNESRTCFNTFYPFGIFPAKRLGEVELDNITLLYGGNGSGKSTLLNIIARKLGAVRYSDFNDAPLFDKFIDMCQIEFLRFPEKSFVLASDDVFEYVLSARSVNEKIDEKRNDLFDKYVETHREFVSNKEIGRLKNLDDYERWNEVREILSPKKTQSQYIKKRVVDDIDLRSNGETAVLYFMDRIKDDAVYFLDEPENSLSVELQIRLADFIYSTARFEKCQFIIATHSPIFLSMKNALVYNLDGFPAGKCKWTELPNVRRYFEFFMERKGEFE